MEKTGAVIPARKRRMRKRGEARMEQLLDAALSLLRDREWSEITFRDIYEHAEIPPGSAYHFFDNIDAIHSTLIDKIHRQLMDHMFIPRTTSTWLQYIDHFVDSAIRFYNANIVARRLLVGSLNHHYTNPADRLSGQGLERALDMHFILPEISNRTNIFIIATKLGHLVICMSCVQSGIVTEEMAVECKAAIKGYLRMYLPEILEKRQLNESGE
jgi:AcrR family transcriptional regulator